MNELLWRVCARPDRALMSRQRRRASVSLTPLAKPGLRRPGGARPRRHHRRHSPRQPWRGRAAGPFGGVAAWRPDAPPPRSEPDVRVTHSLAPRRAPGHVAGKQKAVSRRGTIAAPRLHHHRRRLGWVRPGQSADGRSGDAGSAAGSRGQGQLGAGAHARRGRGAAVEKRDLQLGFLDRAGAEPGEPETLVAQGQGLGRFVLDQWHGLYPRSCARL